MKPCVLIPCYNHGATVGTVAGAALKYCPVIVVDDGSTVPLTLPAGVDVLRFEQNRGKAAALRAGFDQAAAAGFTHAITMDADDQHSADDLPKFLAAAATQPDALLVGVRDFVAAGAPDRRRRANAVSNFWFRVATGLRLGDTQCGFRCYPLALARRLRVRTARYAFELEIMVRAAWAGAPLVPVSVSCTYRPEQVAQSHYRPVVDTLRISRLNARLVWQSWLVPAPLLRVWSLGQHQSFRQVLREFFADHTDEPGRVAAAVGLGLFCGIAPIWGYQMLAAAALAHRFRLNKAIALLASNISIPPVAPFILYGGLWLGHWLFTGQALDFDWRAMTFARAIEYLGHWFVGSFVLAGLAAAVGTAVTYVVARLIRR
jgi:uncharacterized protein (DUF2062 family)